MTRRDKDQPRLFAPGAGELLGQGFLFDEPMSAFEEGLVRCEPFCACGRIVSLCDGSRRGCTDRARQLQLGEVAP